MDTARYLVTGGAGFIGSHITEALLAKGEGVRVFDNLSTGSLTNLPACPGALSFVKGDIRDQGALREAMRGVEVVYHEAAIASVQASIVDPALTLDVNVTGTQNVLLAARDAGVRRVVFASSASVYGDVAKLPVREDAPPHPLSPYAAHKLMGERLCALFTDLYGLETVCLRYFNVFGPRQSPASEYSGVISRFLIALARGEQVTIFGDGEQTRDFVAAMDIACANALAADAPTANGHAFNVGSGVRTSLNTLLAIAGAALGVGCAPQHAEARTGDIRHSVADISLARSLLGYIPQTTLRDGLRLTAGALRGGLVAGAA